MSGKDRISRDEIAKRLTSHLRPLAYAYEALARIHVVADERGKFEAYLRLAESARERSREDDDRKQFFKDLKMLPNPKTGNLRRTRS